MTSKRGSAMALSNGQYSQAIRSVTRLTLAVSTLVIMGQSASALSGPPFMVQSQPAGTMQLAQGTPWQSSPEPQVGLPPSYSTWPTYQQPSGPEPYHGGDPELARVQDALRHFGYATGPSDGRWGPRTADAARRYLRDRGYDPSRMSHDEMRTLILAEAAGVRPGD
jgi:hypothetical protein